jgi:anti-sigma-K factor RskA
MTDKWQNADWDLFAMGALDERTQREMHEHLLTQCRRCTRSYQEAVLVMDALASAAPSVEPSPHIAEALRARLSSPTPSVVPVPTPNKRRTPWLPWLAAAACALLALWLGARLDRASQQLRRLQASSQPAAQQQTAVTAPIATQPSQAAPEPHNPFASSASEAAERAKVRALGAELASLQRERDAAVAQLSEVRNDLARAMEERNTLQTRLAAAQQQLHVEEVHTADAHLAEAQIVSLTRQLETANSTIAEQKATRTWNAQVVAFLQAGEFRQIELRKVDAGAGEATAVAFYAPDRGLIVLARSLPPLPGEKCYQLWSLHKAGPAILSAGLFKTDASGAGFLYAPPSQSLRQLTALAITDEPKGGSVSAKGHKLLFGALN